MFELRYARGKSDIDFFRAGEEGGGGNGMGGRADLLVLVFCLDRQTGPNILHG